MKELSPRAKIFWQWSIILAFSALAWAVVYALGILQPKSEVRRVQFRAEASGGVVIVTLRAGDVVIAEPLTTNSPWSKTVSLPRGTEVYLTAANPTQTGFVLCEIKLDNAPWKSARTTAPKDGAACAGIVP